MRKFMGLFAALAVMAAAQVASAAETMLPKFDASKTVQVNPSLTDVVQATKGLDAQLQSAAAKQKLAVYVVFTQQGDESTGSTPFGEAKAVKLGQSWRGAPGFPTDNHLIIVMVRAKANKDQWAPGVQIGDKMKKYISDKGIADAIADEKFHYTGGNHDYTGFTVALTTNISRRIGASAAAVQPNPTNPTPVNPTPTNPNPPVVTQPSNGGGSNVVLFIIIGLVVVVAGGAAVYFFIVAPANELKALKAELVNPDHLKPTDPEAGLQTKWDAAIENVNGAITAVQRDYKSLASGTWKFAPDSASDKSYDQSKKLWARLYAHREAAKARNAEIKAVREGNESELKKARRIVALLRTEPIVITGEVLKATEISLLGGLVNKESHTAVELIGVMDSEIKTVVSSFEGIETSIKAAKDNADKIRASVKTIETKRKDLEGAGLTFDPYQEQFAGIEGRVAAFVARISGDPDKGVYGDPLGAKADSDAEKTAVATLLTRMTKAVDLQKGIPTVEAAITAIEKRITTQRSTPVVYKYPAPNSPKTFELKEDGANPDAKVAAAHGHVKAMKAEVLAGQVDEAASSRDHANACVTEAGTIIDHVLSAKSKVESEAPEAEAKLGTGPVQASFKGMLASTYGAGNFLAALAGLAAFQALVRVREKKAAVVANRNSQNAVTSAETDAKVNTAVTAVDGLESQFARASTNWKGTAASVEALIAQLETADQAVAADVQAHATAASSVQAFATAYNNAAVTVNDRRVSQAHQMTYNQLNQTVNGLQHELTGRKANWASIASRANQGTTSVNSLVEAAAAEIRADEQAEAAINAANNDLLFFAGRQYVRTIRGVPYGVGVSLSTVQVIMHQQLANTYYRTRQYDLMYAELQLMNQAQWEADLFAWYSVMLVMSQSTDPWARQYAYDQGFRDGMSWQAYQTHQVSNGWTPGTGTDSVWEPTPDTSWTPPAPDNNPGNGTGSGGGGFEGGSNDNNWPTQGGGSGDGGTTGGWEPTPEPDNWSQEPAAPTVEPDTQTGAAGGDFEG